MPARPYRDAAIVSLHHLEQRQALHLYDLSRPLWVALAMGRDGDAEVIRIDARRSLAASKFSARSLPMVTQR